MRAAEFIQEGRVGKISQRAQQPSAGINTYGDKEKMSTDYVGFKLGQAMGMSDGSDTPIDIDSRSWYGKQKTVQPYTEIEQQKFEQAAKAVGAKIKDVNNGDMQSHELKSTNTVSPVSNWMKSK